jgi:hypothetical protein
MAIGDLYDETTRMYMKNLREIDAKREGLDFEISDMLNEMDTVAQF